MVVVGSLDLVNQFLRHLLACLIVLCKGVEELFLAEEVLVELRRQLHKVAGNTGSGESRVLAASEHSMECVSELMEEGFYLIIGKQRRFVCCRTCEVHHIDNMRTVVGFAIAVLRLKIVHPCTAALAVPRVEVGIVNRQIFALFVKHLVGFHFGVVNGNVLVLFEGNAVETLCQTEDTLDNRLFLKVRTEIIVGDGIFLVFQFLGIVTPVPRLDSGIETVCGSKLLQFFHFGTCGGHITVAQLVKQLINLFGCLCHRLVERFLGIGLFAKEVGECQTGVHYVDDNLRVIVFATNATTIVCRIQLTTDIAVVEVLHHRDIGGRFEVEQPAFNTFLLCIFAQDSLGVVVQTCQERLVGDEHGPRIGSTEYILPIEQSELAQFGGQLAVGLFVFGVEVSTVVGKRLVDIIQEFGLLFVKFQLVFFVIHRLDTFEETFVEADVCRILRHLRSECRLDAVEGLVGVGVGEVVETTGYQRKHVSRFLVCLDGVGEGRFLGVVYDSVDFSQSLTHTLLKSGHVVFGSNLVEGIRTMWCFPFVLVEEWVVSLSRRGSHSRHCRCGNSHSNQ